MDNLHDILSARLKQKHAKLTQRFIKNLESGSYHTYTSRTRRKIINRLKKLERQLGLAKKHSYNVGLKHWAMALALGVVVSTADAQDKQKAVDKKPTFKERLQAKRKKNIQSRTEALSFTKSFQLGVPAPENVHIADFDNDGDQDAMYVPYISGPFILNNQGAFSFSADAPFLDEVIIGSSAGDFDGDGDTDILYATFPSYATNLLTNDGTGYFSVQSANINYRIVQAGEILMGDVDGDSDVDIIPLFCYDYASCSYDQYTSSGFKVHVNDNLTFNPSTDLIRGGSGQSRPLALVDIDGDGDLDIPIIHRTLASNSGYSYYPGQNYFSAFINDGSGNFSDAAFQLQPSGSSTFNSGIVADIDGDGDVDFLARGYGYYGTNDYLLVNDGSGNFSDAGYVPTSSIPFFQDDNTFIDLNGDAIADLISGGFDGDSLLVYQGDGTGSFTKVFETTGDFKLGDLDNDGDEDFFRFDGSLDVFENTGGFAFAERATDLITVGVSYAIATLDIDGDGDEDIVQAGEPTSSRIWLNDGTGSNFTIGATLPVIDDVEDLSVADIDGDGDEDILISEDIGTGSFQYYDRISVLKNTTGTLTVDSYFNLQDSDGFEMADMDGDGDKDIVSYGGDYGDHVIVMANDGAGGFTELDSINVGYTNDFLNDIQVFDIDMDADMDVVLAADSMRILLNDGSGYLSQGDIFKGTSNTKEFQSVAHADIDGDGDIDLIVTALDYDYGGVYSYDVGVFVFENDGSGVFTETASLAIGDPVPHVGVNDLDGDGDLDLVLGGYISSPKIYLNDGAGNFSYYQSIDLFTDEYARPVFSDLDNDGDDDIVFGGYYSPNTVFLNNNIGSCDTDTDPPIVQAQPITVTLDRDGTGEISDPALLDNGSSDACSATLTFSVEPATFTLADIGTVTVNFFAEDESGNVGSTTVNITVEAQPIYYDSLALLSLYDATGGESWTDDTNWNTSNLDDWTGISVTADRVSVVDLSDNNLTGSIPVDIIDLTAASDIILSNNNIESLDGDISALSANIDLSNNLLDFEDFELQSGLANFSISGQRINEVQPDPVTAVFSGSVDFSVSVPGANNTYQWYKDGEALTGETASTLTIPSASREDIGTYYVEVSNSVVSGLTITSTDRVLDVTGEIDGVITIGNDQPATAGDVHLLKITTTDGYDTTAVAPIGADGSYTIGGSLTDYLLVAEVDTLVHPNAIPTYYTNTIFWAEADTLRLEGNVTIDIESVFYTNPDEPTNLGVLTGTLEEETDEGGRVEARGRVRGAGVSMRRGRRTGRGEGQGELAYYVYTDENGEFRITDIEPGDYNIDIQYPGFPMDVSSEINVTIGTDPKQQKKAVDALVDEGQISVRQLVILSLNETFESVKLFPNPTHDRLKIYDVEGRKNLQVEIFNLSGASVKRAYFDEEGSIEVSKLPVGEYIVRVTDKNSEVLVTRIAIKVD